MTGFANATGGAARQRGAGSLKGQWNVSIMSSQSGSQLPNIIGAPMFAQYQVVMKSSQPWELTVDGVTERSPALTFQAVDTAMPGGYGRLDLTLKTFNGYTPTPTYFPSTEGIFEGPVENNPDVPTTWGLPFVEAASLLFRNEYNGEIHEHTDEFLFDTGDRSRS